MCGTRYLRRRAVLSHSLPERTTYEATARHQNRTQLAQREANSRAAYELARVRYENGLTSFLDDLDAQRTLLQAQRDRVSSDSQLAIQLVSIYKAIGGNAIEP